MLCQLSLSDCALSLLFDIVWVFVVVKMNKVYRDLSWEDLDMDSLGIECFILR